MELRNSGNPVNNIQIATLKEKTSLKLPKEYERFLQLNNGGYVDGFFVTPKFIEIDPESGKAYSQSSNVEKFYSVDEILEEYEANQEDPAWDENYLPIAYDSSGNVFLLCLFEDENYGKVYFANHELFNPVTDFFVTTNIADSFDAFVDSLRPFEG
ncbi:MAG: SMI1/KNR4 family protein [Ruminococcus sp.]|nr:SMI1/KNR4 family protein [Ruminococcus sp.]